MGMPFSVIFSIILIVVFIITAGIVVRHFLGLQKCSEMSIFLKGLQDNVDKVWQSSAREETFTVGLPSSIKEVCFTNMTEPLTDNKYSDVKVRYGFYNPNFFFYPPEKACEIPYHTIKHLNISSVTKGRNPYCITNENNPKMKISKGFYESLVRIEKV